MLFLASSSTLLHSIPQEQRGETRVLTRAVMLSCSSPRSCTLLCDRYRSHRQSQHIRDAALERRLLQFRIDSARQFFLVPRNLIDSPLHIFLFRFFVPPAPSAIHARQKNLFASSFRIASRDAIPYWSNRIAINELLRRNGLRRAHYHFNRRRGINPRVTWKGQEKMSLGLWASLIDPDSRRPSVP